jgi:hypothetical protein
MPPSVSLLCIQCGIPNISQPYNPPRPVMEIALLFTFLYFIRKVTSVDLLTKQAIRNKIYYVQKVRTHTYGISQHSHFRI